MKKVFLDTNIILDFLDKKRPFHPKAKALMTKLIMNDYEIVMSEDMLSTIFYINKDKERVLAFFKTIMEKWKVVPYGSELILEAIALCQKNRGQDLEDTLQCLSAKRYECFFLVTSDKGFVPCDVDVFSYEEVLERF